MASIRLRRTSAGVLAAATAGAGLAGVIGPAAHADALSTIRQCESGGNYSTNTGNGFYGAYQFTQQTWSGLGYSGRPDQASPATQDAAAAKLLQQSGTSPWPVCGRGAGTYVASGGGSSYAAPSTSSRYTYRAPVTTAPQTSTVQAPAFDFLSIKLWGQTRDDVRRYQQALVNKGYQLAVDGNFGPQTDAVTKQYQKDHALLVDGIAGPQTDGSLGFNPAS